MTKLTLIIAVFSMMFLALPQNTVAQKPSAKVYWMLTAEVPMGKLGEYHAFADKELYPVQKKYGYHLIGTWQTIVGEIEQVISIAEFDNMEAYNTARRNFLSSDEWKTLSKKLDSLIRKVESRFLRATPYSGIK